MVSVFDKVYDVKLLNEVGAVPTPLFEDNIVVSLEDLSACLQEHKRYTVREVSEKLGIPITTVDRWFSKGALFSVPDTKSWYALKGLLSIETTIFDKIVESYNGDECAEGVIKGEISLDYTACDVYNGELNGDIAPSLTTATGISNGSGPKLLIPMEPAVQVETLVLNDQGGNRMDVSESCVATLRAQEHGHQPLVVTQAPHNMIRRLTPLECERLQGFPDGWTDIDNWVDENGFGRTGVSDTARYKALGNSIALPFWRWLAERIVRQYSTPVCMASLFDGIGGFPKVFSENGCEPVWASEIDAFPIAVTRKHFPNMQHLGNICDLKGDSVPIVDIVTGGSPCQDISLAGKREGLQGDRSGLVLEQLRLIKEMREYDKLLNSHIDANIRPRYMVWENVVGAFSSNKGDDFYAVLQGTVNIADTDAVIPRYAGDKWQPSGCVMGDGWSIAWRVHDAQFWGVPQRRKRISLVADFGGASAPEILFEREGLSWNFV